MGKYTKLIKKLDREIEDISGRDLTGTSLDMLDKMAHTIKSLKTIEAMDEYPEGEGYHYDGMSYARGHGPYANRDSMGRYAEGRYEMEARNGYAEDDAYPERRRR